MRILVIGAVAAGTSAAAKARRNDENAQIVIYEKDSDISYSGCGMPYYLGGEVQSAAQLTPRDAAFFKSKYNVDVLTRHEVLRVRPEEKQLEVKNLETGAVFFDSYDKLVVATGAVATVPPIKGAESSHVFTLRSIADMRRIKSFIDANSPKTAAIIGTGFIGLEVCESLGHRGLEVTLIEKLDQVTPRLDADMAVYVQRHIEKKGVSVYTGATVSEITPDSVRLSGGETIMADMVLISTGVKPNVALAQDAGIALGETGAIKVDEDMRTNVPDVYACGDCIEQFHVVTGKPVYCPLGSTANKTGRIAGDVMTGGDLAFRGILGTGIFRIFDIAVAHTGLSEAEARAQGYDVTVCHNIKPGKPEYMGGGEMVIKAVADNTDGRVLGAQIVGPEGVDKRIDVFVTAISFGARAEDLTHLDLAYAPPFSTTKDPVIYTGMILGNAINRGRKLMTAEQLRTLMDSGETYTLIDARAPGQYEAAHIETAQSVPHADIRQAAQQMDKEAVAVTYCNKGVTGNAAQNILLGRGFKEVYNLSGGHKHFKTTQKSD